MWKTRGFPRKIVYKWWVFHIELRLNSHREASEKIQLSLVKSCKICRFRLV